MKAKETNKKIEYIQVSDVAVCRGDGVSTGVSLSLGTTFTYVYK